MVFPVARPVPLVAARRRDRRARHLRRPVRIAAQARGRHQGQLVADSRATAACSIASTRCCLRRPRSTSTCRHDRETPRHSRLDRLDRPQRAGGRRCASHRVSRWWRWPRATTPSLLAEQVAALSSRRRGDGRRARASIGSRPRCGREPAGRRYRHRGADRRRHASLRRHRHLRVGRDGGPRGGARRDRGGKDDRARQQGSAGHGGRAGDGGRAPARRRDPAGRQRAQRHSPVPARARPRARSAG